MNIQDNTLADIDAASLWESFQQKAISWANMLRDGLQSPDFLWQAVAVIGSAGLAWLLTRRPKAWLRQQAIEREDQEIVSRVIKTLSNIVWPAVTVLLLWIATAAFASLSIDNNLLRICASLLNAWIIIRLLTSTVESVFWSRTIALVAWTVAALYILNQLGPARAWLESVAFSSGDYRLSVWQLLVAMGLTAFTLWIGGIASSAIQGRLRSTPKLSPSMAGLLGQIVRVAFLFLTFVIALSAVGINLTALAVIGGGLSVGIGFGLQTVFSNFISGIIILAEKSLKVGDFVELDSGATGVVKEINIRSTLLTTNDNVDILVPNEQFIKASVINWTLRDARRRVRVPFGVAYGTDKELVKTAALEAAAAVPFTIDNPPPGRETEVWLVNFGESSLDFELVVWLNEDAVKKPAKVNAAYMWELETALSKYGIEIPFPQRDLHIVSDYRDKREANTAKDDDEEPST